MNFIKSNIIFVIIMAVTLIGSAYLIYINIEKHIAINKINEETQADQKQLDTAIKHPIKPVEMNITKLAEDTEHLQKLVLDLQRIFGNPYRNALLNFAKNIKMSESELKAMYRDLFNKTENKEEKTAEKLTNKFFDELIKAKKIDEITRNKAFDQFINDAQKETIETLDRGKGNIFFGIAMGIPRTMNPTATKTYLGVMQSNMLRQHIIPGVETMKEVCDFTFNQFIERVPAPSEIPDILFAMPMYEHIFDCMRNAGISKIINFSKDNIPVTEGSYKKYTFHTTFISTLDAARKFAEQLQNAYKNNRVYIITWISIKSNESQNEVNDLKTKMKAETSSDGIGYNTGKSGKSRRKRARATQSASEFDDMLLDKPGKAWISSKKMVEVKMNFKYCVFTGEELKIN